MLRLVLGAVALTAVTTLTSAFEPAVPAVPAEPATCDGQPVTLVAGPGEHAEGTAADDVVVVDGARSVDAGDGDDRVCVVRLVGAQQLTVDAGDGADRVLVESRNSRPTIRVFLGDGADVFHGGPADEWVLGRSVVRARMGGGDDRLSVTERRLRPDDAPQQAAPYDGGPGRDRLVAGVAQDDLDLDERIVGDLGTGTVVAENGGRTDVVRTRRFEDLRLFGEVVVLRGNDRPNSLQGYGCTVRMIGRGGADSLAQPARFENFNGCRRGMTMRGGPGSDTLVGRAGPDHLVGGPGRDTAIGNAARDVCLAEVRLRCERR